MSTYKGLLVEVAGFHIFLLLKLAFITTNSVDPDEMPQDAASHLGLHCLLIISQFWDQEKELKQNKQPNNGQCCLFIVGVSTGFGHAMTFFKRFWDVRYKSVCLFDLILYVPVNNLSAMFGRVFQG